MSGYVVTFTAVHWVNVEADSEEEARVIAVEVGVLTEQGLENLGIQIAIHTDDIVSIDKESE